MAKCTCAVFFLAFTIAVAQDYIEAISNNTSIFKSDSKNVECSGRFNVLKLWEQFSKLVVLRNGTSEQCRRDSQLYLDSLDRHKLWALKMFDATAKPPPGILSGNGNQYGDFDECLSIDGAVRGKYCIASLQVTINGDDNMKAIDYLVHSGHLIRSNLTDPGHLFPRYSSLLWGICIPNSCSNFDLENELSHRLSGLGINVRVYDNMCSENASVRPYSLGKIISITFFLAIILVLSVGTVLDGGKQGSNNFKNLLSAFSLKRNLRAVLNTSEGPTKLKGMDMFRGMNALVIFLTHKNLALIHNPIMNKTDLAALFNAPWTVVFRSGILFVDSFLYISGFLNGYNLFHDLERKGTINFKDRFIARWFRLFPLLLSTILFCTYILPDMNHGPQWNLLIGEQHRICEKNMWKNLFFIHNYFDDMCWIHTHQISMDMQLYVASIPLVVLIWKHKTLGWTLFVLIAIVSTVLRYLVVYWHDISMFLYSEIPLQKLLEMVQYCHTLPTHRATTYLMGILMAYLLNYDKLKFTFSKSQTILLWCFCFGLATAAIASPYRMGLPGYKYEHYPAALFTAFSPILWGLFMCLSHWAIFNDYASIATSFVESRLFKFYYKISYSVYLTQFPIFFYNVGVQRNAEYYTPLLFINIPEFLTIIVISIITTITIEMPFQNIHKIVFGQSKLKLKDK